MSFEALLVFGIPLVEGTDLPWREDPDDPAEDDEVKDWWVKETGFEPTVQVWTADGNYLDGFDDDSPEIEQYFVELRAHLKKNPLPVEVVEHCGSEHPMYVLAPPGVVIRANPGDLVSLGEAMAAAIEKGVDHRSVREFARKYFGDDVADADMKWWLCAYEY